MLLSQNFQLLVAAGRKLIHCHHRQLKTRQNAVRCLEHAMVVVVAGENNVSRTVVSLSLTKIMDENALNN
jgi:hypothetical protein